MLNAVSRPRGASPRGLETAFNIKDILVRGALAQTLFQMAEPRRTGSYKNPNLKKYEHYVVLVVLQHVYLVCSLDIQYTAADSTDVLNLVYSSTAKQLSGTELTAVVLLESAF